MSSKWHSLDSAARANLSSARYTEFVEYRNELKANGHEWDDDAVLILTGFIWDNSEGSDNV